MKDEEVMELKKDNISDHLIRSWDKTTIELFGIEEAKKLRKIIDDRYKRKGLPPIQWD